MHCYITNTARPVTVNVNKIAVNDEGGTTLADEFQLYLDGQALTAGTATVLSTNEDATISSQNQSQVIAGVAHEVTEDEVAGYDLGGPYCFVGGQTIAHPFTVAPGTTVVCNVYNYDKPATLTIVKNLIQDNGAKDLITSFSFKVNDGNSVYFDQNGQASMTVPAGNYSVIENESSAYKTTYTNCMDINLANGDEATCYITNDDLPAYLTLKKKVINNNGGTLGPNDFPLIIDGDNYFNYTASGMQVLLDAGNYNVGELQQDGYITYGWDWWKGDCSLTGKITVTNGGEYECTITNDDLPGKIVVHKEVVNDNGGNKRAKDFSFKVDGGSWERFNHSGTNIVWVDAGWHNVYEKESDEYRTSYDGCKKIYVKNGETKHCYITNDDRAPEIKVVKITDPLWHTQDFNFELSIDGDYSVDFTLDSHIFDDQTPVYFETDHSMPSGWVSITEEEVDGWRLDKITCYKYGFRGLDYVGYPFKAKVGEKYICKVFNSQDGEVVVTKFNDRNKNGYFDEDEETLEGWDITVTGGVSCDVPTDAFSTVEFQSVAVQEYTDNEECVDTQTTRELTTDENGQAVFGGLDEGIYTVDEVLQDGWEQTAVYCEGRLYLGDEISYSARSFEQQQEDNQVYVTSGKTKYCYVGNYQTPMIEAVFTSVCRDNFPYIQWSVTPTGVMPTEFTFDWVTVDGNDNSDPAGVIVKTQTVDSSESSFNAATNTYSGELLWPGADIATPDWPGWSLENGVWVLDPSDEGGNLRPEAEVRVTVNPTDSAVVLYPSATSDCAPPSGGSVLGASTTRELEETGSSPLISVLVGLTLLGLAVATHKVAKEQ